MSESSIGVDEAGGDFMQTQSSTPRSRPDFGTFGVEIIDVVSILWITYIKFYIIGYKYCI